MQKYVSMFLQSAPVLLEKVNAALAADDFEEVANQLHKMRLVKDEETVLFTSAVRTTMKHASNSIEIHKIKELRQFPWENGSGIERSSKSSAVHGSSS